MVPKPARILSLLPTATTRMHARPASSSAPSPVTFVAKPAPSKRHHHRPIPDHLFPQGFLLAAAHSGIKRPFPSGASPSLSPRSAGDKGPLDLTVIVSTTGREETSAAACFTKSAFAAAPVLASRDVLMTGGGRARGVVVNSGCANAVTGARGMEDARAMVEATDSILQTLSPSSASSTPESLVLSTGVIGQPLPAPRILSTLRTLASSPSSHFSADFASWERAARALMTTDTFPKLRARAFSIGGREYRIAGMDKGAGMIHPDMKGVPHATLLGVLATDAPIAPRALQSSLEYAVQRSFNAISVDGDQSTNDTVVLVANGAAGGPVIEEGTREWDEWRDVLTEFTQELARLVVRDGEGATKFVTVEVEGAGSYEDAHAVAAKIATSALVKTALYGEDANWGRILAAAGSVPLSTPIDPSQVSVSIVPASPLSAADAEHAGTDDLTAPVALADATATQSETEPLLVLANGEPVAFDETRASRILGEDEFGLRVELGVGREGARYWTCDLSYEYVRINGDYRS